MHRSLESYEAAKAHLFSLAGGGTVIANAADPVVMRNVPVDAATVTFGSGGDWYLDGDVLAGPDGPFAVTGELWRALPHDIENTLAVAASLAPLGVSPEAVARAASTLRRWRTASPRSVNSTDRPTTTTPRPRPLMQRCRRSAGSTVSS